MAEDFSIKLAGLPIGIQCLFPETRAFCRDYLTEEAPVFSVCTGMQEVDFEREKSRQEDLLEGIAVRNFPDTYLETLAVYRKIATALPGWDTVLFHGSAIAVDGEGYLFTAKSGTGKSTHTRLWRALLGERAVMINDDKPLLRRMDGKVYVCGTPWNGKHGLSTNRMVPLKAVCFLQRGESNAVSRTAAKEAFPRMIQQTFRPAGPAMLMKSMQVLDGIAHDVSVYDLKCNMDPEAARVAFVGMGGIL